MNLDPLTDTGVQLPLSRPERALLSGWPRTAGVSRLAAVPPEQVLVIGELEQACHAVAPALSAAGLTVVCARNGQQAMDRCLQQVPDLIVLDLRQSGAAGLLVCQSLRASPLTALQPILVLTRAHDSELIVQACSLGAVDFISSPWLPVQLLARVRTHLALQRSRQRQLLAADLRAERTERVAHDLKNPLCSIQFNADLLLRAPERVERVVALAEDIRARAGDALQFIAELLTEGAAGEAHRSRQLVPVAPVACIVAALADVDSAAQARCMHLSLRVEATPLIKADALALRHVMVNLLGNAVQHAHRDSAIETVVLPGRAGFLRIEVCDRGPGVDTQAQAALFKRYTQAGSHADGSVGSGLGLSICKQEIFRMGGELWYEDRPGGGARFIFELPLAS